MARGQIYCKEITGFLMLEECYRCKVQFAMAWTTFQTANERNEAFQFYCPNGHGQHYVSGETEADKMRRERDRLKQQMAQKDDEIAAERRMREAAEKAAAAQKGNVTKLRKRAAAGVCPCCHRTVGQMARHMATKHPGFKAEEAA